jgi:SPP1 gp7 family putative phage head morphogenesis protein
MSLTLQFGQPHEEAARLIEGKAPVAREVFDGLLPELRGRAFTITGIEGAAALQRVRDEIATVPRGATWAEAKEQIVAVLEPWLGEEPGPDGGQTPSERRAELLLRTHAFQAFQAGNWRVAQEDEDTTHLQYLATEDDHVRDSHLALNGVILPKDDPFWDAHFPPWEWGCRCRVRPINPDLLAEARAADDDRAPDERLVLEGPALDQLRNGTLLRGGRRYDVTPSRDRGTAGAAFQWHPDDLRLPLDQLKERYDPEVWSAFESWAKGQEAIPRQTVLEWGNFEPVPAATLANEESHSRRLVHEVASVFDARGDPIIRARSQGAKIVFSEAEKAALPGGVLTHNHPDQQPPSLYDYSLFVQSGLRELRVVVREGVWTVKPPPGGWGETHAERRAAWLRLSPELQALSLDIFSDPLRGRKLAEEFARRTGAGVTYHPK